ncbi:MAG: helix-turn-helix domain-containing protein [Spirochaetaceae bacterium]|nr:helix-turn-helix domain-containing protein [Spirochaetaceae bacterium]
MKISQEKLAEFADVSVQMINFIESCRTWVSDKTLVKLARALRVQVFQLLVPGSGSGAQEADPLLAGLLGNLRQNIKDDIDTRFNSLIHEKKPRKR